MIKKTAISTFALALFLGMFTAVSASAQPAAGMTKQAGSSEHQQVMRDMMKQMSQELKKMMEEMKGGDVTSEKMKQMDKHLERISIMMSRMSGARDQMFKQMEEMKRDPSMKSPTK